MIAFIGNRRKRQEIVSLFHVVPAFSLVFPQLTKIVLKNKDTNFTTELKPTLRQPARRPRQPARAPAPTPAPDRARAGPRARKSAAPPQHCGGAAAHWLA